jgi:8-oxo-dGTP pyrophosphatase MutT (NUDIX family)
MTTATDINLPTIATQLTDHHPELFSPGDRGHAAVAMLLREGAVSPEVLFIIRAEHDQDPWSGDIGFPGGRLNHGGESPRQAAERETDEELGLDLSKADYLGRLDDLYGATLPVLVSCFVYYLPDQVTLQPNHEVATTFWCPLTRLLQSERHQHKLFSYHGEQRKHPVVELLQPGQPLLWGITYRLVCSFFALCGVDFGSDELIRN